MTENAQPENSSPSLTFGVEMELVYVHDLADFQQLTGIPTGSGNQATGRQRREYVASILRHQLPIGNNTPSLLGTINVDNMHQTDYTQWTVTEDASIGAGADEIARNFHISRADAKRFLHWDQIELISPVFRFCSEEQWLPQISQIQADLASRGNLGASYCNDSCGLHVHFALETQQPHVLSDEDAPPAFPLQVLQNLVILWAFWEKNIESFHPFYRRPKFCEYARSLLASARGLEGFNSWTDWAQYVYGLQSSEEIRDFIGGRTVKYVKVHISPAREQKRETVEFREHRGTINAAEIRWWVVFIERVIQYAWRTAEAGHRFFQPGSQNWNVHDTEHIWRVLEMPIDGRQFLRGKIYEYSQLTPDDYYPSGSSSGMESAGSQNSLNRNSNDEMELDGTADEDVDPNNTTMNTTADGVQAEVVGEVENMGGDEAVVPGSVVDAVAEWGAMAKYGGPDPLQ